MSALFCCARPTSHVVLPVQEDELNIKPLDILLVDKSRVMLKAIDYTLRKAGHRVTIANNGDEALRIIQEKWTVDNSIFQVILFDLQMPCQHSLYYTNRIKSELEDHFTSNGLVLPFQFTVGITNNIPENDYACDKYLLKPFSLQEFNIMVRRSKHEIYLRRVITYVSI